MPEPVEKTQASPLPFVWLVADTFLVFVLFYLYAGWEAPDVNEAHYLAKAKNYWSPLWCANDQFLKSSDAHLVFYWTFGWLSQWLSLPALAWTGRLLTWALMAWSWTRLSHVLFPKPLVALLAAALFLVLLDHCHMAGEWIVGGVEAKGFAFVLLFLAMENMVRNRWNRVWPLLGLASAFHVLVGGWAVIAALCGWYSMRSRRPSFSSMLPWLALGGVISLAGLIPALRLTLNSEPHVANLAQVVYVYHRLPHHLVFHTFHHWFMARHALLFAVWLTLCLLTPCDESSSIAQQRPIRAFVFAAFLIAIGGALIDQCLLYQRPLAAGLLRYYWFRLSDAALPLGTSIAIVGYWNQLAKREARSSGWVLIVLIGACVVGVGSVAVRLNTYQVPRSEFNRMALHQVAPSEAQEIILAWKDVCRWIDRNTPDDEIILTPRHQQTFKWYANRAEVASWKDIPQDAQGITEWWKRQRDLYPTSVIEAGVPALGEQRLQTLSEKYGFRYVVVDRRRASRFLSFPKLYPNLFEANKYYEVYIVPPRDRGSR